MKKTSKLLAALMVGTLVLTGCSNSKDEKDPKTENTTQTETVKEDKKDNTEQVPVTKDVKVKSLEDVDNIVKEAHPELQYTKIEFNENNGSAYYEVDGRANGDEIEMRIDKTLGTITNDKVEKESEMDMDKTFDLAAVEDFDEGINKALEQYQPDAEVQKWAIEYDDGILIYNIDANVKGSHKEFKIQAEDNALIEIDN